MYDPSVTARQVPLLIACMSQSSSPIRRREFHIQVLPQSISTSMKSVGRSGCLGAGVDDVMATTYGSTSRIEQITPSYSAGNGARNSQQCILPIRRRSKEPSRGHIYMSEDEQFPAKNGAVPTVAQVIKAVMSSAAEAKIGALLGVGVPGGVTILGV